MKIAIFPNPRKKASTEIASSIKEFLQQRGVEVVAEDDIAETIGASTLSSIDANSVNFMISIGGDGTILRLIHKHPNLRAPIMPINFGSLGFMADIPTNEIFASLENLLQGRYQIQNRMTMEGRTDGNKIGFAVNEIAIHRAQNPCLIDLAIHVDGRYLNTFSADGMIIATPGGSTAYSLAAGGPILTPELDAFVLTPICPHTISNRPIVLLPKQDIRIEYCSHYDPVEVIYDGFPTFTIATGQAVFIQKAERTFPLVSMPNHDFFFTLRTKLGWSGKLRS